MNIAALRVCHRFATLPSRVSERDVAVGDLAVVMGWSLQKARAAMDALVAEGMLARTTHIDWYVVTDQGARTLMADEVARDRRLLV